MKMGKHCFCQKPLAHNLSEVQTMARIAAEKKLVTQMGTQIHATENYRRVPGMGVMFVGERGQMFADYDRYRLYPEDKFRDYKPPAPTIPRSIGHWAEWIEGCRKGTPTTCNFDYAACLTEAVLLGNVAYRSGQKLQWDAANLKATNCPEAERFIRRAYRKGWKP